MPTYYRSPLAWLRASRRSSDTSCPDGKQSKCGLFLVLLLIYMLFLILAIMMSVRFFEDAERMETADKSIGCSSCTLWDDHGNWGGLNPSDAFHGCWCCPDDLRGKVPMNWCFLDVGDWFDNSSLCSSPVVVQMCDTSKKGLLEEMRSAHEIGKTRMTVLWLLCAVLTVMDAVLCCSVARRSTTEGQAYMRMDSS